jgi:hypothetical protein
MKAPVWYLIMHISDVTGGDGWHRAYLIDMAYRHLSQWWFAGMPIEQTADWMPYILGATGGADMTNAFLSFGIQAGLAAILLFILLLTRAFSSLGKALAVVRHDSEQFRNVEVLLWSLGAMLVTHVVNWFGIAYFDQMYVIWFMQLAVISTLSEVIIDTVSAKGGIGQVDDLQVDEWSSIDPEPITMAE